MSSIPWVIAIGILLSVQTVFAAPHPAIVTDESDKPVQGATLQLGSTVLGYTATDGKATIQLDSDSDAEKVKCKKATYFDGQATGYHSPPRPVEIRCQVSKSPPHFPMEPAITTKWLISSAELPVDWQIFQQGATDAPSQSEKISAADRGIYLGAKESQAVGSRTAGVWALVSAQEYQTQESASKMMELLASSEFLRENIKTLRRTTDIGDDTLRYSAPWAGGTAITFRTGKIIGVVSSPSGDSGRFLEDLAVLMSRRVQASQKTPTPSPTPTVASTATPFSPPAAEIKSSPKQPGFEALAGIVGLLAVAWVFGRRSPR